MDMQNRLGLAPQQLCPDGRPAPVPQCAARGVAFARSQGGTGRMSYKDLIYSVEGKVATVTLNRPERMNALSRPLEAEMRAAFDEGDADPNVRAIILTGAGAA